MQNIEQDGELIDIVDNDDNVIDTKERSDVYNEGLSNYRVVNAFIVNSKGQIWTPRRAGAKRLFPSSLDTSMGGHVKAGESYESALRRELKEELRLDIEQVPCHLLGYLTPSKDGVSAFMKVYEIRLDRSPHYSSRDFQESFWLRPKEILDRIRNHDVAKGDLPKLIRIFYLEEGCSRVQSR